MDQQLMCAEDRVSTFSKSVTKDGMACVKAPGLTWVGAHRKPSNIRAGVMQQCWRFGYLDRIGRGSRADGTLFYLHISFRVRQR